MTYRYATCPPKLETLDFGSEESGGVVQTCRGSGRAEHEALVRYGEGASSKAASVWGTNYEAIYVRLG